MLFQLEASGVSADQAIELFWRTFEDADPEGKAYADAIVRGVGDNLEGIDKRVTAASQNWRLERMSRVDRNLLRLGTWELMFRSDVPRAVILDEAVELAKSFGTDESSGFVVAHDEGGRVGQDHRQRLGAIAGDGHLCEVLEEQMAQPVCLRRAVLDDEDMDLRVDDVLHGAGGENPASKTGIPRMTSARCAEIGIKLPGQSLHTARRHARTHAPPFHPR